MPETNRSTAPHEGTPHPSFEVDADSIPARSPLDVSALLGAYRDAPDPSRAEQRIAFGTSGHRGSPLKRTFNEGHVLAIAQAIADHRRAASIDGPLFLGGDTHAASAPAMETVLDVLRGNDVAVVVDWNSRYTPTPVVSHAILTHNRDSANLADGIVVTPSHNPPEDGGLKYNTPDGGPADASTTRAIETRANELLEAGLRGVRRSSESPVPYRGNLLERYVAQLGTVLDMDAIAHSGLRIGVDPMGGASLDYWDEISDRYRFPLEVVNRAVDPTFSFMPLDHDGRVRMDCSSPHAMAGLIGLADRFDLAFGLDPDADRHGIVTPSGLMNPNHYLAVAAWYLFQNRPGWSRDAGIGKTVVTSSMIDRVAADVGAHVTEVPVGFKWFVQGLHSGALAFAGEESAGASLVRRDRTAWTTDKDGIVLCLLAAEITAVTGRDPSELYREIEGHLGASSYQRIDEPATATQKAAVARLDAGVVTARELAGEPINAVLTRAPGNGAPLGGIKVVTANGWFAARPSGTEDILKIYAESFLGPDHLARIFEEARAIVNRATEGG